MEPFHSDPDAIVHTTIPTLGQSVPRRGNRLLPPMTARNITTVRKLAAKYAP